MKIRKYILVFVFYTFLSVAAWSQRDMRFVDLPLTYTPNQMVEELQNRGLHLVMGAGVPNAYRLTGHITGLQVTLDVYCSKDTLRIEQMCLTTNPSERSQHEDYAIVMRWMQKHYGSPNWESFVRSHSFARWYMGFDKDIVLIATAKSTVEVWFYNNHQRRHFDYYSILKYCERNPVSSAPHYTARECVTWKSDSTPVVKKKPSKRQIRKKASKKRQKAKTRKTGKRRRR